MNNIRVLIADDHPAFRKGIRLSLESHPTIEVVGEAPNGKRTVELARELKPDLILMDMEMPELSGLEVARTLLGEDSGIKILPLSAYAEPEYIFGVLESGADGYLMKDEPVASILEAIQTVMDGGVYMSPRVSVEIVTNQKKKYQNKQDQLEAYRMIAELGITPRLLLILKLAAEGLNNEAIADKVHRSHHTIRNQIETIKSVVGVRWRPALVAWAWKNNIMVLDEELYENKYKQLTF